MMGDYSFQSFFYLCSIIKETPRQTLRKKRTMNHLIQSLKEKITDQMSLEDMVNVFEEMCGTPFDENIFDYIRNSEVFAYAKDKEYLKVKIYLDET